MKVSAFLFFSSFVFFYHSSLTGQESFTDQRTGVVISFDASDNIFPRRWHRNKIKARVISLPQADRNRIIASLEKAFSKYPANILHKYLKTVFVLKKLEFFGLPYGGTYSKNNIYISSDDSLSTGTDFFVESIFHHEFSSILLKNYKCRFDENAWKLLNPHDFVYGKGGISAISDGTSSMVFDANLNKLGFLNKYSQSSIEEDINVFSQNLFCGNKSFWEIVDKFDIIRAKTHLIIEFYNIINPVFTESYFRNL